MPRLADRVADLAHQLQGLVVLGEHRRRASAQPVDHRRVAQHQRAAVRLVVGAGRSPAPRRSAPRPPRAGAATSPSSRASTASRARPRRLSAVHGGRERHLRGLAPVVEVALHLEQRHRGEREVPAQLVLADLRREAAPPPPASGARTPATPSARRCRRRAGRRSGTSAARCRAGSCSRRRTPCGAPPRPSRATRRPAGPSRRRSLLGRLLQLQPLVGVDPDEVVEAVAQPLARIVDRVEQLGLDEVLQHLLGVEGVDVEQRGGRPAGEVRGGDQREEAEQALGVVCAARGRSARCSSAAPARGRTARRAGGPCCAAARPGCRRRQCGRDASRAPAIRMASGRRPQKSTSSTAAVALGRHPLRDR